LRACFWLSSCVERHFCIISNISKPPFPETSSYFSLLSLPILCVLVVANCSTNEVRQHVSTNLLSKRPFGCECPRPIDNDLERVTNIDRHKSDTTNIFSELGDTQQHSVLLHFSHLCFDRYGTVDGFRRCDYSIERNRHADHSHERFHEHHHLFGRRWSRYRDTHNHQWHQHHFSKHDGIRNKDCCIKYQTYKHSSL